MAYEVFDSYRTVETFGGLDSRDVQRSGIRALPSGVSFYVQISPNAATFADEDRLARATAAVAEPYVEYVNAAMMLPGVTGIYSYDDFNASNAVETRWVVTIASSDGDLTTTRDIPFTAIRPENFPAIVQQTQASLNALQASGQ
jgi:hypothetical protein